MTMDIGGIDIILDVPPRVRAVVLILDRVARLWPNSLFVDAEGTEPRPISDAWVRIHGEACREFLIYRDHAALESWRRDGAVDANANAMLHFLLDEVDNAPDGLRELTIVCDERDAMIDRLVSDLELDFGVDQAPASAAKERMRKKSAVSRPSDQPGKHP